MPPEGMDAEAHQATADRATPEHSGASWPWAELTFVPRRLPGARVTGCRGALQPGDNELAQLKPGRDVELLHDVYAGCRHASEVVVGLLRP